MSWFTVTRSVVRASGTQTFSVEAESPEEAARKVCAGEGRFVEEDLEITDLSDQCSVWCQDVDFPRYWKRASHGGPPGGRMSFHAALYRRKYRIDWDFPHTVHAPPGRT